MLKVSDSIRNAYNQYTTQRKSYIQVGDNSFFVQNLDVSADAYDEGNVVGNAIAKIAKFDIETEYVKGLNEFELFDGIWTGNQYEYVSLGTFKLYDEEGADDFFSSVTSYDKLILFNKPYDSSLVNFPITLYNFLKEVCFQAGVELENNFIPNGGHLLDKNLFVEGETLKQILKAICQISGNFAKIKNDKLVLGLYDYDSYIATGNKIVLEDVVEEKTKIKQYGYTKQNVYSGKNKNVNAEYVTAGDSSPARAFTNLSEYGGYKNVVEVSSNIGYMTLRTNSMSSDFGSKIATGGIDITTMLLIKKTNINTRVNFYLGSITGGAIYNELKHYKDEANGWAWYYTTHTIPASPNNTTINNHISSPSTNFATFYIAKIQTLIASEPSDFEPYVGGKVSPSPDYPQEIEVGRGKNLLNPIGSSGTRNGITFTDNGDGSFTAKGTATSATSFGLTDLSRYPIYFKKGEYYTQSLIIIRGKMEGNIVPAVINSEGTITYNYLSCSNGYLTSTRQIEEDLKVNGYTHYIASGKTVDVTYKVKLEKGKVATKWLPYGVIETVSTSNNLFNAKAIKQPLIEVNEDGSEIKMPVVTSGNGIYATGCYLYELAPNLQPGDEVYLGLDNNSPNGANKFIYLEGTAILWKNNTTLIMTQEILNSAVDLYGNRFVNGETEQLTIYDLRMIKGKTNKPFEPYKESSIQYNLGDNFIADKDYIENGVLNKNVRHLRLAVADMNTSEDYPGWTNLTELKEYFPGENRSLHQVTNFKCNIVKENDYGIGINTNTTGNIWLPTGIYGLTKTQWQEQYPDLVLDLYYEIPETEQIPLETTGELRTFEPNTIITNDLDSEMEVEYGKYFELKKYQLSEPEYKRTTWFINQVVLGMSDVEGEYVLLQDDEDVEKNGVHKLVINDNPFVYSQELRQSYITELFNQVKGFGYIAYESKLEGMPFFELGDLIKIDNKKSLILRYNLKSPNGLESTISAPSIIDSVVDYVNNSDTLENKVMFTEFRVSKAEGEILATTKKLQEVDTTIDANYQKIINKFGDYTPTSKTLQLENSITQLQTDTYTKTEINTKLIDGSVTKVMTTSGTFDENGMHYEKTGAPTKSTINESGVNVESSTTGEELLFAGYDEELKQTIVRTENLTVRRYLVIGKNSRIEDYTDEDGNEGGGIFTL